MKLVKLGFISIVVLFILATLIGLLFPSTVLVSRAIDVHANKQKIQFLLFPIQQWNTWMEAAVQGEANIVTSNNGDAQYGNMRIQLVQQNDSMVITRWIGNNGIQLSTMRILTFNQSTTVQWQFEQQLSWYPWERLGSMMNDKILGNLLEANLKSLQKIAEQQ
jgi:hypothetical protein